MDAATMKRNRVRRVATSRAAQLALHLLPAPILWWALRRLDFTPVGAAVYAGIACVVIWFVLWVLAGIGNLD